MEKFKILRKRIVNEIVKSKKSTCISTNWKSTMKRKFKRKLFRKTSKQILSTGHNSTNGPSLTLNNEYAESDTEKANMLNDYFSSQA